ncbi:MAG: hypothetical protein Sapg2KO_46770 [Saprospiraceae bacterium]
MRTFNKLFPAIRRRNIKRLLPIGLIWLLSGWVFLAVELAAYHSLNSLPETAIKMDFQLFIWSSLFMVVVGLLTGFIELRYLQQMFVSQNFLTRLFYKMLAYLLLFAIIMAITFPIAASLELNTSILDPRVWNKFKHYFTSLTLLSTTLQLSTALLVSLFYFEISEFIGFGVLRNFFTGKYHQAIEEERIFMFLDMKSSTTIAEQLGHVAYFKLLRAYYDSFTAAIIQYEGAIYQYVGDEIVLSWKAQGHQKNQRCIDCFFALKSALSQNAPFFQTQFGLVPSFKAGIHLGKVTAGEIGVIKKDILFSGDVLNASARIQSLCNSYGVDLIISEDLKRQLPLMSLFKFDFLGKSLLKGKEEKKSLYTVKQAE